MNDDQLFEAIASRFGFSIPIEYRRMHYRGWLSLDRPPSTISTTPGDGYLWMNDMEWYALEEIAVFEFPEYYRPHLSKLVPFAFTAGGDYWCWQADQTDQRGTRVLLCAHDSELATIYAPNFHAALYRQALDYATYLVDIEEGRGFLRRWSVDFALLFPPEWCRMLLELSARPLVGTSLLSREELAQMERRDLPFDELDTEVQWSNLQPV